MSFQQMFDSKLCTLEDALDLIKSGDVIAASGVVSEPTGFFDGLSAIYRRLEGVKVLKSRSHIYDFLENPDVKGHIITLGHLFAEGMRSGAQKGLVSYLPSDLSSFASMSVRERPNNVFVAMVTEMDENGNFQIPYCQMYEREMLECAETVILEVNRRCRRVRGGLEINVQRADAIYRWDKPLLTLERTTPGEVELAIGGNIAQLVHDGDTIQLGIGKLPDAVAIKLMDKNDLGLHSEMFTSTMGDLIKRGNITGKFKTLDKGEHIAAFTQADQALYDTLSDNPACRIVPCSYANDPFIIMQQENMKSINTCMEIDLTGQICSESQGPAQYSGTGGASDFALGAFRAKGGRGMIAFASTARHGTISKIKSTLTPGAVVSINRNLADTVITEYGVAELRSRSVAERARALIAIAHPNFRDQLTAEAKELKFI